MTLASWIAGGVGIGIAIWEIGVGVALGAAIGAVLHVATAKGDD
ncbi:MAG: hypothetical protein AAFQ54_00650 [Pseudomonadota bacterium]